MEDRVANFLSNWVDANIVHAAHDPDTDAEVMASRYLTDAVAAGVTLEDVNEGWGEAERLIEEALAMKVSQTAR